MNSVKYAMRNDTRYVTNIQQHKLILRTEVIQYAALFPKSQNVSNLKFHQLITWINRLLTIYRNTKIV